MISGDRVEAGMKVIEVSERASGPGLQDRVGTGTQE